VVIILTIGRKLPMFGSFKNPEGFPSGIH
jgi:hypothetical protein